MPNGNNPGGVNELGPDSMLGHYAGDWRIGFTVLSAGVLMLMSPDVGLGVDHHSHFFDEKWHRLFRSAPPILGSICDPDPEKTAREIRDIHKTVRSEPGEEPRYHALHSETWWWTHATFHNMYESMIDDFSRFDLTPERREQLYGETSIWFRRYGVSARALPPTYDKYQEKFQGICQNKLEMTPSASRAIDIALSGDVDRLPKVPPAVWKFARLPVSDFVRVITIGGLPEEVRQRFDLPWNDFDAFRLKTFQTAVRNSWHFLPGRVRYHERTRAGHRAAKAA